MKAVVLKGVMDVQVEELPNPKIEQPTDAIVRITSSAICGSDLHMYWGRTAAGPGLVFGHEPMGVIAETGNAVYSFKQGDRVVMPFNVSCGFCTNCQRGFYNACLTTNPDHPGAAYGYANMGPWWGGQAEYLRVPFADFNCLKLPGEPNDKWEDDFVLLADVFPTAYHAAVLANVQSGSTVAVFGAGPVGLLSAYSALLRGASMVFVVDHQKDRLAKVKEMGAIPIDFTKGDPVEQITTMYHEMPPVKQAMRPGDEKMTGIMCGIDAVGYQALDQNDPRREQPMQVINDLARLVDFGGNIGVIGVYTMQDPRGPSEEAQRGEWTFPFGLLWEKGIQIGTGQAIVKLYQRFLRDLIIAGRTKPSFIVSHRMKLEEAPEAYKQFSERDDMTKVVLKVAA